MACTWCREPITPLDAQTSSGRESWHTRCWNEAAERQCQYIEEMDNLEGFTPRPAPPDGSRPALPDESGPKPIWSEVIEEMATATNNRPTRDVVEFPPNGPVTVALKYPQGRTISGQYGERVMYTLTDGRVMFLAPEVAERIESLGINVRESFTITRGSSQNGAPASWDIARVAGEQPNGTLVLQAPASSTPKLPAPAATADGGIPRTPPGSALVDEANILVDSFAQVLERSLTLYQGRIKPEKGEGAAHLGLYPAAEAFDRRVVKLPPRQRVWARCQLPYQSCSPTNSSARTSPGRSTAGSGNAVSPPRHARDRRTTRPTGRGFVPCPASPAGSQAGAKRLIPGRMAA